MGETREVELTVTRQEPDGKPYQDSTPAPVTDTSTVLDVLEWAKAGPWPTLAFRFSCRSGVCGSCGVMVNGRPVMACETNASGYLTSGLTVAPLARIPVLRDLVTDVDGFIARMRESLTWLIPAGSESDPTETPALVDASASSHNDLIDSVGNQNQGATASCGEIPSETTMLINHQTPAQLAQYRLLAECINCLLCYAACPVFPLLSGAAPTRTPAADTDSEFLGPAAIALAQRWTQDSRDHGEQARTAAIAETEHGIWACTQDGSCTRVCPKGLDPKKVIGALQKEFLA